MVDEKLMFVDIKNFPEYRINKYGDIWSVKYQNYLKGSYNPYHSVVLVKNGKYKNKYIHRLIAENFIPNPENKPQINHKDGDKKNNSIDNLEWCTSKENIQHAHNSGLCNCKWSKERRLKSNGYHKYRKGYRVLIGKKYIGWFKEEKEARECYVNYIEELFDKEDSV